MSSANSFSEDRTSTSSAVTSSENHTCPYDDCNKSFSKKYNLKAHLRLHTGEEPFECDRPDCNKKFKWRSSLSSHSVWHTRKDNATVASVPSSRNNAVVANNKVPLSMPRTKPVSNLCRKVSQNHLSTQSFIRSRHVGGTKPSFSKHASATPPRSNAFSNKPLPKRVPPTQPVPQQHVDDGKSNNVSPCLKRKRPRCDVGAASEVVPPASHVDYGPAAPASFNSNIDLMSIAVDVGAFDTVPDRMATPCMYRSKPVVTGPKKRKCASTPSSGSNIVATGSLPGSCMGFDDLVVVSPGSPVSSDGDMSEETLGLNVFSCDILPPLIPRDGDALELGGDDVGAIINVVDEAELFGYGSPCGALNSLDTRFGPFDLDNIQSFCLNKVEGL